MSEILFKLTNERLKILENEALLHPDEDFCAYCPENIFPDDKICGFNAAFKGIAEIFRRGDFLNVSFDNGYILQCVRDFKRPDALKNGKSENFWTEYARLRIESVPGKNKYDYTANQLARTAALNAIPRKTERDGFSLSLERMPDKEIIAKLFFKYDSARESDSMLDTELLNFILEVCK